MYFKFNSAYYKKCGKGRAIPLAIVTSYFFKKERHQEGTSFV